MAALVTVLAAIATSLITLAIAIATTGGALSGYAWLLPYLFAASGILYVLAVALGIHQFRRGRKYDEHSSPPAQNISQTFNPYVSPQQNVYFGFATAGDSAIEQEKNRREKLILDYMKRTHATKSYSIDEIALDLRLSMPDVRDALETLKAKKSVWSVQDRQAKGGTAWFLDELEHDVAQERGSKGSELPTLRPKIVPVRWGRSPDGHHGLFLRNDGEPAFDILVEEPVRVGTSEIRFWERVYPGLTKEDGELLIDSHIVLRPGHGITGNALRDEMRKANLDVLRLLVKYRDIDNIRYATSCELVMEVWESGLRVGSVRQERIP